MIQSVRKGIRMNYSIKSCEGNDAKFIRSSLVQYNVSKVPKTQKMEFEPINRKIVDENGNKKQVSRINGLKIKFLLKKTITLKFLIIRNYYIKKLKMV